MSTKLKFTSILMLVLLAGISAAMALPSTYAGGKITQGYDYMTRPGQYLFNSQELSFDIGGSYTTPEGTTIFSERGGKGVWGFELDSTYWIKRFAGIGIFTGIVNTKVHNDLVFSHLDPAVSLRLPFDLISNTVPFRNVAAVGDGAFGRDLEDGQYETILDAGIIVRLTKHIGVGAKDRHVWETANANNKNQILVFGEIDF
jgi:hypothetical protein